MTKFFRRRIAGIATAALLLAGIATPLASTSASAAPEVRLTLCDHDRHTNAGRTQSIVNTRSTCRGSARARIEFRPDGGSVGMTLIHNGAWVGAQMTSVATRTIPNHHYVRGFSETRAS